MPQKIDDSEILAQMARAISDGAPSVAEAMRRIGITGASTERRLQKKWAAPSVPRGEHELALVALAKAERATGASDAGAWDAGFQAGYSARKAEDEKLEAAVQTLASLPAPTPPEIGRARAAGRWLLRRLPWTRS